MNTHLRNHPASSLSPTAANNSTPPAPESAFSGDKKKAGREIRGVMLHALKAVSLIRALPGDREEKPLQDADFERLVEARSELGSACRQLSVLLGGSGV
ncbi:MAG: hypothetical protein AAF725_16950 [Acidobacteriota bacterium]